MLAIGSTQMMEKTGNIVRELMLPIFVVLGFSWLASLPVSWNFSWYLSLEKPWFNPAPWVFSTVWPMLYVLMTCAAWLVWRQRDAYDNEVEEALALFLFQLVANFFWPLFFFGMQSTWLGLLWIGLVWVLVGLTLLFFYTISRLATLLLLPYWLWVSFACCLNYAVWTLNG